MVCGRSGPHTLALLKVFSGSFLLLNVRVVEFFKMLLEAQVGEQTEVFKAVAGEP